MKTTHWFQVGLAVIGAGAGAAAIAFPQYAPLEAGIAAVALAMKAALSVQSEVAGDKAPTSAPANTNGGSK